MVAALASGMAPPTSPAVAETWRSDRRNLAQWSQKLSQIVREHIRLFVRREVTTPVHFRVPLHVVGSLGPAARGWVRSRGKTATAVGTRTL